jgi:protein-tyrosine phosphatase
LQKKGLDREFDIDSAGTSAFHQGELADSRMRTHSLKRDIKLLSKSRKVELKDFSTFDHIVAMDRSNYQNLEALRPSASPSRLHLITDFLEDLNYAEVPDPYYGGEKGFEVVLDILEESCENFLNALYKE